MLKRYNCQCGNPIFFRNSSCLVCKAQLGYDSELGLLVSVKPAQLEGTWERYDAANQNPREQDKSYESNEPHELAKPDGSQHPQEAKYYRRCANLPTTVACNWLIQATEPPTTTLCKACSLNRTIPDLSVNAHPLNSIYWGRVELAKRRMLAGVLGLGLRVVSKQQDPENGLAFDLVSDQPGTSAVLTGHDSGLITLNLQEADDAARESIRSAMHEPYRTLLGHFRHEIGHYFWNALIKSSTWLDGYRQLFGDESQDYTASLQKNYSFGPPDNWQLNYISSYASTHPWEDWAETWAHYLHMRDTLDTAVSFGLTVDASLLEFTPFTTDALRFPNETTATSFLTFLNEWTGLTVLLNEMSRTMGQPDFYPFALPVPAVAKLHFVHAVIESTRHSPRG